MGLYFLFFITLILFSIYDIKKRGEVGNGLFCVLYVVFSFLLIFRYGQGTDYFGYEENFNRIDIDNYLLYKDIGFSFLVYLSKYFGIRYEVFNILYSSIIAVVYYIFIVKNSRYRIFALCVLYCVFYFPIISSAMRQSLAIGIFGAFMLPQLRRNEKIGISYYCFCLLCCLFHIASIITFFFPLINRINVYKHPLAILILASAFAVLSGDIINGVASLYERGARYLDKESGSNALAFLARLLMLLPVLFVRNGHRAPQRLDFQSCILFFLIYLSTWNIPFISGRLLLFLRLYYIPGWEGALQQKNVLSKRSLMLVMLMTLAIMYIKEVNTAIYQGDYMNCNIVSYPFISIFNQQDIFLYRRVF